MKETLAQSFCLQPALNCGHQRLPRGNGQQKTRCAFQDQKKHKAWSRSIRRRHHDRSVSVCSPSFGEQVALMTPVFWGWQGHRWRGRAKGLTKFSVSMHCHRNDNPRSLGSVGGREEEVKHFCKVLERSSAKTRRSSYGLISQCFPMSLPTALSLPASRWAPSQLQVLHTPHSVREKPGSFGLRTSQKASLLSKWAQPWCYT